MVGRRGGVLGGRLRRSDTRRNYACADSTRRRLLRSHST